MIGSRGSPKRKEGKKRRSEDVERPVPFLSLSSLRYGRKRRASLRSRWPRRGRTTTACVSCESASGTRWLYISLALNIAEAKVVPASLYGPLPPTTSRHLSLSFFPSLDFFFLPLLRTYLCHLIYISFCFLFLPFYFSLFLRFPNSFILLIKFYMNCFDIKGFHTTRFTIEV